MQIRRRYPTEYHIGFLNWLFNCGPNYAGEELRRQFNMTRKSVDILVKAQRMDVYVECV